VFFFFSVLLFFSLEKKTATLTSIIRKIYEEIGKVGDTDNREICKHKLEELDPSIKYCLYNLGSKVSNESTQTVEL